MSAAIGRFRAPAIFLRERWAYEAQEDRNRSRGYRRQDRNARDSGVAGRFS
jgi:hypothetical protein